jgi:tetratricopeptide (TPR) repeat protein
VLWPSDTFVDFEHSLNVAVNRLREALEDSADQPKFIETLPRRGYRFIGPVEGRGQLKRDTESTKIVATQASAWFISEIGGREQEALAEANRAHQLDPISPIISSDVGIVLLRARRYDEAIDSCSKVVKENPTFARVHEILIMAYWAKQMYPQTIEQWKVFGELSGDRNVSEFASALEQGFRLAGWTGALSKGIEALQAQRKTGSSSPYPTAQLYADLGNKEEAFRWLSTAYEERDRYLTGLKTDFLLDPLRADPRFADLVRKIGLPQ